MVKKYNIIYADPPWQFKNKKTGGSMVSGAANQYNVESIEALKLLDIERIAADDCVLIMWWVGCMPQEAIDLVAAWGFTLKNMNGIVWRKLTKRNLDFFGMGFWTRAGSESAIIATRGKPKPASHSVRAVHSFAAGKHSKKPDQFRDIIVALCGDLPRIELFCRDSPDGWDTWGNECECSVDIGAKE